MRALVASLVLLLVAMTSSCTDDEPDAAETTTTTDQRVAFCDAYEDMLDAQAQWTTEYLNGLTPDERNANRAEQDAVAEPVRELMPEQFVAGWDELVAVGSAIDDAVAALQPAEGTSEQLLREVQGQGFASLTEYVMRDGLEVEGEVWTFERAMAASAEQAAQFEAYFAEAA